MIRRPPRSTPLYSSAASDVYKRQGSQRERRSPLSGSRLRGQALRTVLLVVVGLRHGSVGLVRASRADSLILVVDFGRRVQSLLQPLRTDEWRRAPKLVHLLHFFRDLNIRLSRDLLHDELHREQRSKILGSQWIVCRRVERRHTIHWDPRILLLCSLWSSSCRRSRLSRILRSLKKCRRCTSFGARRHSSVRSGWRRLWIRRPKSTTSMRESALLARTSPTLPCRRPTTTRRTVRSACPRRREPDSGDLRSLWLPNYSRWSAWFTW